MSTEKSVEFFLSSEVTKRGGFCLKLDPRNYKGLPDRLVILPSRIIFFEVKKPRRGVVSETQKWWNKKITDFEHECYIVKEKQQVIEILDKNINSI
jgi:hypothetical protein